MAFHSAFNYNKWQSNLIADLRTLVNLIVKTSRFDVKLTNVVYKFYSITFFSIQVFCFTKRVVSGFFVICILACNFLIEIICVFFECEKNMRFEKNSI